MSGNIKKIFDDAGWEDNLIRGKTGPKAILANAIIALRDSPKWQGALAFDLFRQRAVVRKKLPWWREGDDIEAVWVDQHDRLAADWLQHNGIFVSPDVAGQAAETVARLTQFHPIVKYLDGLEWDKKPRLETWAIDFLGSEDTPFVRAVSLRFPIGAVARILEPGCKNDCAPILEGDQGLLKSTALRTLFSPWFTDDCADLGSKDAAMQLAGAWLIELAELDSISRPEISKIKAFMSRQVDRFRPPYGRRVVEQPRQCVFAGTTNNSEYLRDETGGRRFWPLCCAKVDIPGLTDAKDQLWAEAVVRYDKGEKWWLDTKELNGAAAEEQAARLIRDPWHEPISEYISARDRPKGVSVDEILATLGVLIQDRKQADANRVAACLKALEWRCRSTRVEGARHPVKRYYPDKK